MVLVTTLAYVLGIDAVTFFPLTAVAVFSVSLILAAYSGYVDGGVVSAFGLILLAVLWIQIVPPVVALVFGEGSVTWYGTPWPLPLRFTPYEELLLGVRYGSVMALVAATVFAPPLYVVGLALKRVGRPA